MPDLSTGSSLDELQRQIPDFIDLLLVAVESGLGMDAALHAVAEVLPSPLGDVCRRLDREVRAGADSAQTWFKLSQETHSPELGEFLASVFQARRSGVEIGSQLRLRADAVRQTRIQQARQAAAQLPARMVFVNVFLVPLMIVELLSFAVLPTFAVLLLLLVPAAVVTLLGKRSAAAKRAELLERQLGEFVSLLAASVRTGHSGQQAVQGSVQAAPEPLRTELTEVLQSHEGSPLSQVFAEFARRVPARETRFLAAAFAMQERAGTSLAHLLDRVADLIRERVRLRDEITTLTTQPKYAAIILTGIPLALGFLMKLIGIQLSSLISLSFGAGVFVFMGVLVIYAFQGVIHFTIDRMLMGIRKYMP